MLKKSVYKQDTQSNQESGNSMSTKFLLPKIKFSAKSGKTDRVSVAVPGFAKHGVAK